MTSRSLVTCSLAGLLVTFAAAACACTRCVYLGSDNTVVVARSLDWSYAVRQIVLAMLGLSGTVKPSGTDALRITLKIWATARFGSDVCGRFVT